MNPYAEMSLEQRAGRLAELDAQWLDIIGRRSALERETTTNQEHRKQLLSTMGVTVIGVADEHTDYAQTFPFYEPNKKED